VGVSKSLAGWCRRKPAICSLTATTIVLLLALAIGSTTVAIRINRERRRAEPKRTLPHEPGAAGPPGEHLGRVRRCYCYMRRNPAGEIYEGGVRHSWQSAVATNYSHWVIIRTRLEPWIFPDGKRLATGRLVIKW